MDLFKQNRRFDSDFSDKDASAANNRFGGLILVLFVLIFLALPITGQQPSTKNHNAEPDLRLFRPSNGVWYSQFGLDEGAFSAVRFGSSDDIPVPADYDGDGEIDIAVVNTASGVWSIERTSDNRRVSITFEKSIGFEDSDQPVPADYDGDGLADIAFWRPESGVWHIIYSSSKNTIKEITKYLWGNSGDVPVPADYDGDGFADIAVFRSETNTWHIRNSSNGGTQTHLFGIAGLDTLVPADYTGDGKADPAIFRNGSWLVLKSENGKIEQFNFGISDAVPVPADYDGDGEVDFALFRRGMWYIVESSGTRFIARNFGLEGDVPINSLRGRPSIIGVP